MSRKKRIYHINVEEEYKELGFPTSITGANNIIKEIKDFAIKNKREILGLEDIVYSIDQHLNVYTKDHEIPDDAWIEDEITKEEEILENTDGRYFSVDEVQFIKSPKPEININKDLDLYVRAKKGKLWKNDWINYVHSSKRWDKTLLIKVIMKRLFRKAIRNETAFSNFETYLLDGISKEDFIDKIYEIMAISKIYNHIITNMADESITPEDKLNSYDHRVKLRIGKEIDGKYDAKSGETTRDRIPREIAKKIHEKDIQFSIHPNRREKAIFLDKNEQRLNLLSDDIKEAKIKERLSNEKIEKLKGKGVNQARVKRIKDYFEKYPKSSLRQAERDLKIDHKTISKHRKILQSQISSVGKSGPKPAILISNSIATNGAEIPTPVDMKEENTLDSENLGNISEPSKEENNRWDVEKFKEDYESQQIANRYLFLGEYAAAFEVLEPGSPFIELQNKIKEEKQWQ